HRTPTQSRIRVAPPPPAADQPPAPPSGVPPAPLMPVVAFPFAPLVATVSCNCSPAETATVPATTAPRPPVTRVVPVELTRSPPAPPVALTVNELTPAGTVNAIVPGVVSTNESARAAEAATANATTGSSVAGRRRIAPEYGPPELTRGEISARCAGCTPA